MNLHPRVRIKLQFFFQGTEMRKGQEVTLPREDPKPGKYLGSFSNYFFNQVY